ncbi:MAG: phosphoribosylglycinamide formyltransferase [Ignavibacteriaceae bacterium]
MKIAVFVSGRGSNLQAILNSQETKDIVEVKAVISDKIDCGAFEIAKNHSIPTFSISNSPGANGRIGYNELSKILSEFKVELIVLAGFLKLIPADFISEYKNRIINIHPALLPSFGGEGMYGKNVHKAVFESSAKVSGPTVHFVDNSYDTGKIIGQRCVDISDARSPEEIAEKVLLEEHKLLPYILRKFADNKVVFQENRVMLL